MYKEYEIGDIVTVIRGMTGSSQNHCGETGKITFKSDSYRHELYYCLDIEHNNGTGLWPRELKPATGRERQKYYCKIREDEKLSASLKEDDTERSSDG